MNLDDFDFEKCYEQVKKFLDESRIAAINSRNEFDIKKERWNVEEIILETLYEGPNDMHDIECISRISKAMISLYKENIKC